MLSFLIISAMKADTVCTVSDNLTVTGNTNLGDAGTDLTTVSGDLSVGDDLSFNGELKPDGSACGNGQILKRTGADNWDCADDDTGTDTDTWITTQTCPSGEYLSSVGKNSKSCSEPGGGKYCYTYYSTSLVSCTCPAGETNKKNLGTWGLCTPHGGSVFRPSGISCGDFVGGLSVDSGLACVCCEN